MKGLTLNTALALIVLVLATSSETAVFKTTSGNPPSVAKATEMVPSSTQTKASGTSPRSTTTSGAENIITSRNVPTMATEVTPSPTKSSASLSISLLRSSTNKPPTTTRPTGTLCPKGCNCEFGFALVILLNCSQSPTYQQLENILTKHQNTENLVIESSHLTYIPDPVCQLKNLKSLKLDHNEINSVHWYCFGDMKKLKEISLQSNKLQTIDTWPLLAGNARIHLDNNQISNFTNNARSSFTCNSNSRYSISLRNNRISHLADMFNGWGITEEQHDCFLNHSKMINLEGNNFNCDCVDYDIYKSMQKQRDSFGGSAECSKPEWFNGTKVTNLPTNEVACEVPKNCPDRCYCAKIPAQLAMLVNCTRLTWTQLPGLIPDLPDHSYTYILDLSGNRFESVDGSMDYFNFTQRAIFSYNIMTSFAKEALLGLENVTELRLDNNHLYYMPDKIVGVVNFTDSLQLSLGENQWICDCYAKETRKWMLKMGDRIIDKERIICDDPPYAKGRHLLQMKDDELVCGFIPPTNYGLYVGVGAATIAVWLVVIGVPTGILYANRLKLFRKFGWHMFNNDECYGEYKEFDIFLAYAEVNVDYAMGKLFVEFENKGYIVAYHRINYMGGKPIKVNIEECIRKSKRTVIVLSKHFFTREWCRCEIMTALDIDKKQNTKRLIGVLLEEVDDVPELDEKVKKFIKTDHCLRVGEEFFEDKMEYMLARKKLKDQRERRPTREQLRARQQRRRQAPAGNAPAAANAQQPAAGAGAGAAGAIGLPHAPQRTAVAENDRANLLDNEQ